MKTKLALIVAVITVTTATSLQQANAQWNFSGTNIYNSNTGNVGIGTSSPGFKLDVAGRMRIRSSGGSNTAGTWFMNAANTSNAGFVGMRSDSYIGLYGNSGASWGLLMNVSNGNVGIGTETPGYKLDVAGRMRLRTAGGQTAGTWFMNAANTSDAGFVGMRSDSYIGLYGNSGASWGLLMNTANGNVGIGTETPGYKLDVAGRMRIRSSGGSNTAGTYFNNAANTSVAGFVGMLSDSYIGLWGGSGANWGLVMNVSNSNVGIGTSTPAAGFKLTVAGSALASGGMWVNSDQKLKLNISELSSAIDIINQLKPKTYYFKTGEYAKLDLPTKKQYGFIAQEMEKVLPDLVNTSKQSVGTDAKGEPRMEDIKAVNYIELIPILTQAIQEQQKQIDKLKQMVEQLSTQAVSKSTSSELTKSLNVTLSNATLEQNKPNPLTQFTTIRYNIPAGAKNAQIVVTDFTGKPIRQVAITSAGPGEINIDASALSSGTYTYSLLIDGKIITSKKMVVAK